MPNEPENNTPDEQPKADDLQQELERELAENIDESKLQKEQKQEAQREATELHEEEEDVTAELAHDLNPDELTVKEKEAEEEIQPKYTGPEFRTYHGDVAHLTNEEGTKATAAMLRETHEDEEEEEEESNLKTATMVLGIIGALLILGAIVVLYFLGRPQQIDRDAVDRLNYTSLIRSEETSSINVTDTQTFQITRMIENEIYQNTSDDTIRTIYFGIVGNDGQGRVLSINQLDQALDLDMPATLRDASMNTYMLGSYYDNDDAYPFLIIPIASYQRAFDGMRAWEEDMLLDFEKLFALPDELTPPEARSAKFTSAVAFNKTLRTLTIPLVEEQQREVTIEEAVLEDEDEEATSRQDIITNIERPKLVDETTEELAEELLTIFEENPTSYENRFLSNDALLVTYLENNQPDIYTWLIETNRYTPPEPIQYATVTERVVIGEQQILAYSFINENTLVITTDPLVLPEIIARYSSRILFQ